MSKKGFTYRKATGEADQDYDHSFFDAIVEQLEAAGIMGATHKEFDKYQGVYHNIPSVDRFWIADYFSTGKETADTSDLEYSGMSLYDENGEVAGGTRGDYWTLPDDYVFEGYTLIKHRRDGKNETIENPKKYDLLDITDMANTIQFEEGSETEYYVFYPEDDSEFRMEVSQRPTGEVDATELVEYAKYIANKEADMDSSIRRRIRARSLKALEPGAEAPKPRESKPQVSRKQESAPAEPKQESHTEEFKPGPATIAKDRGSYVKLAEGERYTAQELEAMPTISKGHTDDLKIEEDGKRVWLSRMTVADGMEYDNQITVEEYIDNNWITTEEYPGGEIMEASLKTERGSYVKAEEYQGWPNYETWAVNLYLDNDREIYEETQAIIKGEGDVHDKEDALKEYVENLMDGIAVPGPGQAMAQQLIGGALSEVKWDAILRHALENLGEEYIQPTIEEINKKHMLGEPE